MSIGKWGTWAPPARFLLFLATFAVVGAGGALLWNWMRALMVGFDVAALAFFGASLSLLDDSPATIRKAAVHNDANRALLLGITAAVSAVILVTVGLELSQAKTLDALAIGLVIATLSLSWLFSNVIYALHYAHLYYSKAKNERGDSGGIEFPGTEQPDYSDFIYFSFTLGMTFQTSDAQIGSRAIRRVAIFHGFAAFVFNLGVLAFTINVLGSG